MANHQEDLKMGLGSWGGSTGPRQAGSIISANLSDSPENGAQVTPCFVAACCAWFVCHNLEAGYCCTPSQPLPLELREAGLVFSLQRRDWDLPRTDVWTEQASEVSRMSVPASWSHPPGPFLLLTLLLGFTGEHCIGLEPFLPAFWT